RSLAPAVRIGSRRGGLMLHWLLERVLVLIPLWISLGVHEWAHAFAAFKLGDDTAAQQGRLTIDPFAHLDPLGTAVLPLLVVPFGWAKPVPVEPTRFRHSVSMGWGLLVTALAGPVSNLVLAALIYGSTQLLRSVAPAFCEDNQLLMRLLSMATLANVGLFI